MGDCCFDQFGCMQVVIEYFQKGFFVDIKILDGDLSLKGFSCSIFRKPSTKVSSGVVISY